ncbi:hypothetical protein NOF04DRAFT_18269 [Fusarium oxysporum II5]|uniref:Uncharacterized protein n=2 Tax=Fusarium oxysporum species complex TaxID=171631 RepID=X0IQF7_FUSO5|nr:uncharacterized protein FOIG_15758 [Fusarium odoratissimum NRRL 54006]EXL91077.1 hypothetical protein FOIG_15758 [Fusarium odoratissimum NRRL 54006]KAK2123045.1 hypothetical protein NOF04DRAFT_18269 [Fusarium oxysporum II5]TXB96641.1 hypothetical protein FocTR4_00011633 [Fusarium oxysporum f. sp. cubense]
MSRVGLFPSKNMPSFSSCGTCVIVLRFSKAGAASFESLAEMNSQQARGPRLEDSIYWEGTRKQEQAKMGGRDANRDKERTEPEAQAGEIHSTARARRSEHGSPQASKHRALFNE